MKRRKLLRVGICLCLVGCLFASCASKAPAGTTGGEGAAPSETPEESSAPTEPFDRAAQEVTVVDFSTRTGFPLLKRQNMFSIGAGLANYGHLTRDAKYLQDLRSESMRVDMGMGALGFGSGIGVDGVTPNGKNFTSPDMLAKLMIENGNMPYFEYGATPASLQQPGIDRTLSFLYPPVDYDGWKTLCAEIAKHYAQLGYPIAGHEIWNEPDWMDNGIGRFFRGSWEEYCKIYEYAALGIREGNPDARVGGLSLALIETADNEGKVDPFLQNVQEKNLPLDFISFHNYGSTLYLGRIVLANEILDRYGDTFRTTGFDLTEFHVTGNWSPETCSNAAIIPDIWDAILGISGEPSVTSVHWAAWRDNGVTGEMLGMVDGATGKRYAPVHAITIYNNMPIARVKVSTKDYVEGFASVEDHRAGVVVYTRSSEAKPITVALDNLPFDTADIKVYAIDAAHSSYVDTKGSDELECIFEQENVSTRGLYYTGELASRGTLYIEITDHAQKTAQKAVWSIEDGVVLAGETATVLKKEYDFPDRSQKTFAEFDLGSFTAYAGMGDSATGTGQGAAVMNNLPDTFTVTKETWGTNKAQSENANIYLKVDYRDADGKVIYSELYQEGAAVTPEIPWSERTPDKVLPISEGEAFTIDFRNAPEGFGGSICLSYGVTDYGEDTTVCFHIM